MKTIMKPVLVLSIIFGFVLMLVNVSSASMQQQAAPAEKSVAKMETQAQAVQTSKPEAKMEKSVPQAQKDASTMMKSTGKKSMMSSQEVKSVQEALNKDGYKLTVDGLLGNHTRGAIKNFQKKNGLKVTGKPDSPTLAKLNLK
jgi:peptidoglycan hydrolase-like protein with peptidoglycan-binding domain